MELDQLNKYVHITQLVNSVEVMFAGQPCLTIFETEGLGYFWRINPFFAKLTYGADVFNDIPLCNENFEMLEAAIAVGLEKLYDLGAFRTEIDLPEDTYAAEHLDESVEELDEAVVKITTVDGNKALRPGTKKEHQVIFNHGEFKAENAGHTGATVHTVKQPNGFHGVLVIKDKSILASNQNNMSKEDALKFGQHLTKSGFVGASKFGIHLGSVGSSVYKIEHANESVEELDEAAIGSKVKITGTNLTTAKYLGKNPSLYKDHEQKDMWQPGVQKLSLSNHEGEVVGKHGDNLVVKTGIKEFGTDNFKHVLVRAKHIKESDEQIDELSNGTLTSYKKKAGAEASELDKKPVFTAADNAKYNKRFKGVVKATNKQFANDAKKESEEQIDELSDSVKGSYVAKASRNRDELEDRMGAIEDSGAKVDTSKIERKLKNREAGMQKVVSRIPKEVAYSIKEDCRREAMKHCDTLMEAQDLAEGLFESFMEELDEVKCAVETTYDKEKTTNTEAGKKSLYKQIAQSQKEPKTNQWKVKESVDEAYGTTKKAYDPFASAISKVMSRPAFSAAPKDEPEKEKAPVAKKTGRPSNGPTVDELRETMRANFKEGKRLHHGMERKDKVKAIRANIHKEAEFGDYHTGKAGRTVGTTKVELEKRKETAKAQKVDNVMANWMKK